MRIRFGIRKTVLVYAITILLSILFLIIGGKICKAPDKNEGVEDCYRAKVVEIVSEEKSESVLDSGETVVGLKRIVFKAKILNGPHKGSKATVAQDVDDMYGYQVREVKKGDKILISRPGYEVEEGDIRWIFIEYNRIGTQLWLLFFFLLGILLIGRKKGLSTVLSLFFTVMAIFVVYIPAILKGYDIYRMTVIVSVFIIFMSLIIINGWNKKTVCAIFGNITGVLLTGVIALIANNALEITGNINQDYIMLSQIENVKIEPRAVLWGGILIGALGAIMDVSMSIASSVQELNDTMEKKTFFRMLHSAMNIGRDAIGTMTNTLILAYIGGSLATVLLYTTYQNAYYLFNTEMIISEVVYSIVGSMGILTAVPTTAIFSAFVYNKPDKKARRKKKLAPDFGEAPEIVPYDEDVELDATSEDEDDFYKEILSDKDEGIVE